MAKQTNAERYRDLVMESDRIELKEIEEKMGDPNLSAKEIANLIGHRKSVTERYERCKNTPADELLKEICDMNRGSAKDVLEEPKEFSTEVVEEKKRILEMTDEELEVFVIGEVESYIAYFEGKGERADRFKALSVEGTKRKIADIDEKLSNPDLSKEAIVELEIQKKMAENELEVIGNTSAVGLLDRETDRVREEAFEEYRALEGRKEDLSSKFFKTGKTKKELAELDGRMADLKSVFAMSDEAAEAMVLRDKKMSLESEDVMGE